MGPGDAALGIGRALLLLPHVRGYATLGVVGRESAGHGARAGGSEWTGYASAGKSEGWPAHQARPGRASVSRLQAISGRGTVAWYS